MVLLLFSAAGKVAGQSQRKPDVQTISILRDSSNLAIARHDVDALSAYWGEGLVLIRGNSTVVTGKENIVREWKALFRDNPQVRYVRTPSAIVVSSNDTLAWEEGTWSAYHSYSKGGRYSAMWKRTGNTWRIIAELFVSLF